MQDCRALCNSWSCLTSLWGGPISWLLFNPLAVGSGFSQPTLAWQSHQQHPKSPTASHSRYPPSCESAPTLQPGRTPGWPSTGSWRWSGTDAVPWPRQGLRPVPGMCPLLLAMPRRYHYNAPTSLKGVQRTTRLLAIFVPLLRGGGSERTHASRVRKIKQPISYRDQEGFESRAAQRWSLFHSTLTGCGLQSRGPNSAL